MAVIGGLFDFEMVASTEEALALLGGIVFRMENLEPVMEAVYKDFCEMEEKRFDDEGPGWAPLAASTLAHKSGGSILVDSGDMRAAITAPEKEVSGNTLILRAPGKPYIWHQYGTRKMPQRKIVEFHDEDMKRWSELALTHILSKV